MNRDQLLIGLSAAALLLAWWPAPPSRIPISIRNVATSHHYYVQADDPRLANLRKLAQPRSIRCDPALAMAKWHYEAASFYADNTPEPSASSRTVFHAVSHAQGKDVESQAKFWSDRATAAERRLHEIERRLQQQAGNQQPIVRIGQPVDSPLPAVAFIVAAVLGIIVAVVFSIWNRFAPPFQIETATEASPPSSCHRDTLRLVVPTGWVRVRQPFSVRLRRLTAVMLIAAAAISTAIG